MKQRKMDSLLLSISTCGFFLMSSSFFLMPMEGMNILSGALFWAGLLIGVILQIVLEARRRAFFSAHKVKREKMQKPRNGLLTFGSNREAKIADIVLLASFAGTVLALSFTKGRGYVCYVFIAITLFSFCLHCILNGRIYFHTKNQIKIRQTLEHKKANPINEGEEKQ